MKSARKLQAELDAANERIRDLESKHHGRTDNDRRKRLEEIQCGRIGASDVPDPTYRRDADGDFYENINGVWRHIGRSRRSDILAVKGAPVGAVLQDASGVRVKHLGGGVWSDEGAE